MASVTCWGPISSNASAFKTLRLNKQRNHRISRQEVPALIYGSRIESVALHSRKRR